jgi:hypothetical protein
MTKQDLIDLVIEQIVEDLAAGDHTAIDELLQACPEEALKSFLPEEEEEEEVSS